jgi:3-methyladenine DNA glycosylase AlkD
VKTPVRATAAATRRALRQHANPTRAAGVARFFKSGKGEYGEGDRFIGVTVPEQRRVARQFRTLPLDDVAALFTSRIHEERLTANFILADQFTCGDEAARRRIVRFYLKHLPHVNNWDLVDTSADPIVGGWLLDKPRAVLDRLARSKHLWSRRVAIMATFRFIKSGESDGTLRIARTLLHDDHDLIHKAVGWMLREVGKRVSIADLRGFLSRHAAEMPRTMLRYAIERLPEIERRRWMAAKARA